MVNRLLKFSIDHRWMMLMATLAVAAWGAYNFGRLTIDAVPDITNVQVLVSTEAPGFSPLEVEQRITFPIETALAGIPALAKTRSNSHYGISQVTAIFEDGTDIYFARQLVNERIQEVKAELPAGIEPAMGPIATGLGEIFMWTVQAAPDARKPDGTRYTLTDLRTIQDWIIRPQLRNVPGVTEINVIGGYKKQFHVTTDPQEMIARGLTFRDVIGAGEEVVLGTAFMLMGENGRAVSERVAKKLVEVNRTLPAGVTARPVYSRTTLVDKTILTVKKNLFEGAVLVIVILFLFLGNVRAALITALVIPLSMLFAISGMVAGNVSANLMSLGAIDFGIIVDGAVVIVENCARRLSWEARLKGRPLTRPERLDVVREASREVRKPMLFGELIIIIVYLPILTLTGVEGKTFIPMAVTVLLALTGARILSFTFVPAAVAIFLGGNASHKENLLTAWAKKAYIPLLQGALRRRRLVVTTAAVLVVLSGLLATRMGREFIPNLDEGDIAVHTLAIPGTSLSLAVHLQSVIEKTIKAKFPQVERVFTRIGTSEISQEPHPPSVTENMVILKPRDQWPDPDLAKQDLVKQIEREVGALPGVVYEFSQPIRMRFNHLLAGVRSDVAVKIFGDDMELMLAKSKEIATVLREIPGASHVKVEPVTGLPILTIKMNRKNMARYGLNVADVQEIIEIAVAGKRAGLVFDGDRRFDLVVRLPERLRTDVEALKRLPVPLPHRDKPSLGDFSPVVLTRDREHYGFVTLGSIADFVIQPGPNQVRDLGTFVADAERAIQEDVSIPAGYWTTWGGQFEQMISAVRRLQVVVPISLLLIFSLLFTALGSVKPAALVFTGVPLALTGGVAALWLRGIPLSISAGVGFIALSGVAVLNGLVMITFISKLHAEGSSLDDAILQGAVTRLRPVLMTALVASFGFVPMAIATSTGAEVQRPLATVIIGGLISSTILTLFVLPALYKIFVADRDIKEDLPL
ncbi:MAG: CusA/CzcA family heavy metal efflux RND transporter [Deltaproteobacteria bacterium]